MLRKIFERNREEATGWYRRFHIEELHDLYSSLGIIRMMKLWAMTEGGHVAHTGKKKNHKRIWWRKPEGQNHLEDRVVDWRIILKCIFAEELSVSDGLYSMELVVFHCFTSYTKKHTIHVQLTL